MNSQIRRSKHLPVRAAARQDALKAWEEYRQTGLHASAEEVGGWLASWGTVNEVSVPECRK